MVKIKDDGTRYTWQEIADRFGVEHSTVLMLKAQT